MADVTHARMQETTPPIPFHAHLAMATIWVTACVALAACRTATPPPAMGPANATAVAAAPAAATIRTGPSRGCGKPLPPALEPARGAPVELETAVGETTRRSLLVLPPGYEPAEATPLVFVFHGATQDPEVIRRTYDGIETRAAGGAVFVYPHAERGTLSNGREGTRWVSAPDSPDLAFFDALQEQLERELCIDRERVFATGLSSGGAFTHLLSCLRGEVLTAGAPVAAPRGPPASCRRPLPMLITHGAGDVKVEIATGARWRDEWLTTNGCSPSSRPTAPAPCAAHDGCPPHAPVVWCAHPGNHTRIPRPIVEGLWDFFASTGAQPLVKR